MRGRAVASASRRASRAAVLLFAAAGFAVTASAETLLVVRKSGDALDFVYPGSGLRLASVATGHAPHEVSVSPDGRRAVVSNYGTREQPGTTLSIVDLVEPRELRRVRLGAAGERHDARRDLRQHRQLDLCTRDLRSEQPADEVVVVGDRERSDAL
jgi:DNA-binding beta-propeller fold protein YncE